MDEERAAYLDRVLIGGREPAQISVVDYDARWPTRFREIAERLRRALTGDVVGVEHIGSTSVPGLAAKPIIDVLLTVADVDDEAAYVPALESAGFLLRVREPGHRMVRTPTRDVHVHVYEPGRQEVRDYLDLRDWLRVDAADRELYAATKRTLAEQQWDDMNDYADAKTELVHDVLTRARAWRAGAIAPRASRQPPGTVDPPDGASTA
ncbi:GrpB family protein [Modestobacter italicus]|uniref:GrpB family protein n=1 Tax=Modestobacter italicus (strain DSM 44449 / CECT 9708 / BC 501) TaxID=2732864 RepID=UPI00031F3ACB|nr:GrpB family protein [Modestobacter marinus]